MQAALESWVGDWLFERGDPDPYRASTRIGHVGELKQIGTVIARVPARRGDPAPPPLLHRASYDQWSSNTWIARRAPLTALVGEPDGRTWVLSEAPVGARTAITARFEYGRSLIILPVDTVRITDLVAISAARNRLGAVQINLEGGWVRYVAERADAPNAASPAYAPPAAEDTQLPAAERALFAGLSDRLGLRAVAPGEALERVRRHFSGFTYSVYRAAPAAPGDALAEFLTRTRSGHCEYFATATTLLLRAAGIPARYATGYAVMEYSTLQDAWLVRQRHAHAWSRAWVGGQWVDFDTTPADWFPVESRAAPAWETVMDWLHWASFRWSQRDATPGASDLWLWLAGALAVLLAWRLARYRTTRDEPGAARTKRTDWPGRDSEFYALERGVAARGWPRAPEESSGRWAERVAGSLPAAQGAALAEAARLHERYRFDPAGLPHADRARLRELCAGIK
jgi:transglutaminase-like putative cysteine protease